MKYKIAIAVGILSLILIPGLSCIQTGGTLAKAELAVIKKELKTDAAGKVSVVVTVKNTGRVKAELAEVRVSFFDAQKNLIDSSRDSVLNLRPDETWEFTILCAGDRCGEIKSYEIETTAGTSSGGL